LQSWRLTTAAGALVLVAVDGDDAVWRQLRDPHVRWQCWETSALSCLNLVSLERLDCIFRGDVVPQVHFQGPERFFPVGENTAQEVWAGSGVDKILAHLGSELLRNDHCGRRRRDDESGGADGVVVDGCHGCDEAVSLLSGV
jgi:hypothetical protein